MGARLRTNSHNPTSNNQRCYKRTSPESTVSGLGPRTQEIELLMQNYNKTL